MKLRGLEFQNVFICDGYSRNPFSVLIPGFFVRSVSRIGATLTLNPIKISQSRVVEVGSGVMLRAGLIDGRGLEAVLNSGKLQKNKKPFVISVQAIGRTREEQLQEYRGLVELLQKYISEFVSGFAIEVDFSEIDTSEDENVLVSGVKEVLQIFSVLKVPLIAKFAVGVTPSDVASVMSDINCDAISISENMTWNEFPDHARDVFFMMQKSPYEKSGGGYVSGKYLMPLTIEWIRQFNRVATGKPLIVGGGILRVKDIADLREVGVNNFILGSALVLRPWNIGRIVRACLKKSSQ